MAMKAVVDLVMTLVTEVRMMRTSLERIAITIEGGALDGGASPDELPELRGGCEVAPARSLRTRTARQLVRSYAGWGTLRKRRMMSIESEKRMNGTGTIETLGPQRFRPRLPLKLGRKRLGVYETYEVAEAVLNAACLATRSDGCGSSMLMRWMAGYALVVQLRHRQTTAEDANGD